MVDIILLGGMSQKLRILVISDFSFFVATGGTTACLVALEVILFVYLTHFVPIGRKCLFNGSCMGLGGAGRKTAEWRNGGIAEWRNSGMAEWRNSGMVE